MVNPDDEMQQNYTYLLELQQHIFDKLVPGYFFPWNISSKNDIIFY